MWAILMPLALVQAAPAVSVRQGPETQQPALCDLFVPSARAKTAGGGDETLEVDKPVPAAIFVSNLTRHPNGSQQVTEVVCMVASTKPRARAEVLVKLFAAGGLFWGQDGAPEQPPVQNAPLIVYTADHWTSTRAVSYSGSGEAAAPARAAIAVVTVKWSNCTSNDAASCENGVRQDTYVLPTLMMPPSR